MKKSEVNAKYVKKITLLLLAIFCGIYTSAQASNEYSLLITGNTSKGVIDNELLTKWQKSSKDVENLAFLMLGNIYEPEEKITSKELLLGNAQPLLLAPGEKEWANGRSSGKKKIKDLEDMLRKEYNGEVYTPDAACPGPTEVVLSDHLVVILIDTHWWVHKYDRRYTKCGIESNGDVLIQIEDAIRRHYPTKHVVIAGHHSLKSFGNCNGYFSFKQNVIEAPFTLYRKILGTRRDNNHPDFKGFRNNMLAILKEYPDIIYTSAGDANLQYFTLDKTHHIISGSILQSGYVRTDLPEFASSENGYARLNFTSEGACEIIFTGLDGELFRKNIYNKEFHTKTSQKDLLSSLNDSVLVKASNRYCMPESSYFWMGENYRAIWDTPVKAPVFDIGAEKGGLQIIKRGGGQQTLSLRLEDKNGKQYVLRSLEKNVEGALPVEFNNTLAMEIVQDQISASNPYAALVVAKLAEAAAVFHTNPEIVYIPNDPRFGIYQQDVADRLFIFEERPVNNRDDVASFDNSKRIISTEEMIEKIFEDEDHFIDPDAILRARLFDIFINDWDRHDDQWRWASFESGKKTIFKPIPRDRDQAFFVNEGVLPGIAKQKTILPKIQGFDEFTENMEGHTFNARFLDRTFLTQSGWDDWCDQIDSLKLLLSPVKIDEAVLSFPKEVQFLCAAQTTDILKSRLENLELMARELYLSLAREVDITGTHREDLFIIDFLNDTTISITGFHLKNKNKKGSQIYKRIFYSSETEKIRIYGFDSKDRFILNGESKSKIHLSIIGGDDKDEFISKRHRSAGFLTIFDKESLNVSPVLKKQVKNIYDTDELEYDREAFEYDIILPRLYLGYNQDDGLFLGGGIISNKYSRYRSQKYVLLANYAPLTNGYNIHLEGKNMFPLKHLELGVVADIKSPNYVNNYYGMGNDSEWQLDYPEKEYYWVSMREYYLKPELIKFLDKDELHKASIGIFYKNTDVEETNDRFILDFSRNDLEPGDLDTHSFSGISVNYELNTLSKQTIKSEEKFAGSKMFRTRGVKFETEITQFIGLNNMSQDFTKISGDWTSYLSFSQRPRFVYVIRFGGENLFGDYPYHEAAKLGQKENLRAYRNTRFYGDANFYLNTEIRIRSKQFRTYISNVNAGLFLFNDIGRVWFKDENSSQWHDGYGIGFWWSPYDLALLNISYARSKEDNLINFSIDFQF